MIRFVYASHRGTCDDCGYIVYRNILFPLSSAPPAMVALIQAMRSNATELRSNV